MSATSIWQLKSVKSLAWCVAILVLPSPGRAQSGTAVCLAMAQDAAHDVRLDTSSNAYYDTLYKNYCQSDGSTNSSAINGAASAIIQAVPVQLTGGSANSQTAFSNFCKNFQSVDAGMGDTYSYQSIVVGKALDSVNDCLRIVNDHATTMSYKTETLSGLVINFGIPSGQSLVIHGITTSDKVKCVGADLTKGGAFNYSTGVGQTISANSGSTSVTCTRSPSSAGNSGSYYDDALITVDTSFGGMDIYWPHDTSIPPMSAAQIQSSISDVATELQKLQAAINLNVLPIGTILPWDEPNGSAVPKGWAPCDGSYPGVPDLRSLFLRGAGGAPNVSPTPLGQIGGSFDLNYSIAGSNHAYRSGDGFNKGGNNNWVANDAVTNGVIPRHLGVLYIMKIANP